jgi:ubiquinone biosynthesis protein
LENLLDTLENIANRLTFAMIIAAMIVGSSMIITTGVRPHIFGYPAIGVIGYVISAVIGFWLLVNIIRTRNY